MKNSILVQDIYNKLEDNNILIYAKCSKLERIGILLIYYFNSDYVTFVLGFSSALVIEDFSNLFSTVVKDNLAIFIFSIIQSLLILGLTIKLFVISNNCKTIERGLEKHKSGKWNYFFQHYSDHFSLLIKSISMDILFSVLIIMLIIAVCLVKWFYLNGLIRL